MEGCLYNYLNRHAQLVSYRYGQHGQEIVSRRKKFYKLQIRVGLDDTEVISCKCFIICYLDYLLFRLFIIYAIYYLDYLLFRLFII